MKLRYLSDRSGYHVRCVFRSFFGGQGWTNSPACCHGGESLRHDSVGHLMSHLSRTPWASGLKNPGGYQAQQRFVYRCPSEVEGMRGRLSGQITTVLYVLYLRSKLDVGVTHLLPMVSLHLHISTIAGVKKA